MWVISSNTAKYQHQYGSSGDLYYTKTLIKFKKTSSSPPIFVYYTVHFDDNGGDMNTYPKDFKNQVYIVAYGIEGLTDHVDPGVYDAHEAFEIDKTKMKMLVPLDMNGKKIMNTNYDLKFSDVFKIFECKVDMNSFYKNLVKKKDNQILSFNFPIGVLTYILKVDINPKEIPNFGMRFYITPNSSHNYTFKEENINISINLPNYSFSEGLTLYNQIHKISLQTHKHRPIKNIYDIDVIVTYM